jgi:hypothetical protein
MLKQAMQRAGTQPHLDCQYIHRFGWQHVPTQIDIDIELVQELLITSNNSLTVHRNTLSEKETTRLTVLTPDYCHVPPNLKWRAAVPQ